MTSRLWEMTAPETSAEDAVPSRDAWHTCAGPMTRADVAHLLRRVAANATWEELGSMAGRTPDDAFRELAAVPPRYDEFEAEMRPLEDAAVRSNAADAYRTWFLRRLVRSPFPLGEWMTVFWLEHFGLGIGRVGELALFDDVVRSIRRLALKDYHELLAAVLLHPAFLLNVRAPANYRSAPNDRVGAAILRTCLGYRETDFSAQAGELARAFSGRFINRGRLRISEYERDKGEKTILGQRKAYDAEEIPSLIGEDARSATWTARRLYRWFCCELPISSDEFLVPVAEHLRRTGSVGETVRLILTSQWFFSADIRRKKIRRPLDFAAGLLRAFQGTGTLRVVTELTTMGQDILQPTTLDGWPEAGNYFSPLALIQRMNLAAKLLKADENFGGGLAQNVIEAWSGELPSIVTDLMADGEVPAEIGPRWDDLRRRYAASSGERERIAASMIYLLAVSPAFQTA
ncbi:DUF1800 family protein [Thermopirellula anaerolimosa]